jgi:putative ABC transport system permease protein
MESLDWSTLDDIVEHPVAWDLDAFYLIGGEHAEMIPGAWVTPGFVEGLGIRPALGRGFDKDAFLRTGGDNGVLISHRLWNSRFGADPGIVGRTFTAYVSDRPQEAERFTIIGVLPSAFWHINAYTDVFAPLRVPTYPYMVRLRTGVTPQQAAARIASLVRAGARDVPANWSPELLSTHEQYVGRTRPMLWTATAAASLVLLVACANVAALLLVRAVRRQREIAVRTALGARRMAIARMLLAEAVALGSAATGLAVFASALALTWLAPLVQQQLGRPAPGGVAAFAMDRRTLAFAVTVGIVTAVICTLAPLVTSMREGFQLALQTGSRSATEGPGSRRVRATLIALEIAVSLTLLTGSTLMLRTVVALLRIDLGFNAEQVLLASITLRQNRYPDGAARIAVFEWMESRLGSISGVEAVGLTTAWPVQQPRLLPVTTAGASEPATVRSGVHRVNAMYFVALDIPLRVGRLFAKADRAGSEPVVVTSETLARRLWPAGEAVGRRLVVPEEREGGPPVPVERLVIGVVRDVRQGPYDLDLADAYVPMHQSPGRFMFVLTRTAGDPVNWLAPFRSAFRDIDPEISVQTARPLQLLMDDLVARPRFLASLLGAFAVIAAVLALVGVYGVIAYAVRQREREIAVRMALGADPSRLTRLFVRQGGWILLAGLGLGVLGAIGAGRLIENQLFGVTAHDPLTLAVAVAAFATAGLFAVWWPSRRAAATDPVVALRAE